MESPNKGSRGSTVAGSVELVKHKKLLAAQEELMFQLNQENGFELIILVGPTGAGKSTLAQKVFEMVMLRERAAMAIDTDYVPIVLTKAVAHGHRAFDWKRLYADVAKAAGDPFADLRRPDDMPGVSLKRIKGEPISTAAHRCAMEDELEYRRTKYWILDEAAHILSGAKSGGIGDQFDVVKSIAQMRRMKIVLIGSYDLVAYIDCSAQLARRGTTIHLARYNLQNRDDMAMFASSVRTVMNLQRLQAFPSVSQNLEFLYAGCAGCVGTLSNWVDRAVNLVKCHEGTSILTLEALRATRLRKAALETIWRETLAGEALMSPGSDDEIQVLGELALADRLAKQVGVDRSSAAASARSKPGLRSPTRDPIGPLFSQSR